MVCFRELKKMKGILKDEMGDSPNTPARKLSKEPSKGKKKQTSSGELSDGNKIDEAMNEDDEDSGSDSNIKLKNVNDSADSPISHGEIYSDDDRSSPDKESSIAQLVDLSNYFTKVEFQKILDEKVKTEIDAIKTHYNTTLDEHWTHINTIECQLPSIIERHIDVYNKYVETDKLVNEHYSNMSIQLELILKQHKREKSDLQNDNQKLLNRVN